MKNTVKTAIKVAFLLSALGGNASISYAQTSAPDQVEPSEITDLSNEIAGTINILKGSNDNFNKLEKEIKSHEKDWDNFDSANFYRKQAAELSLSDSEKKYKEEVFDKMAQQNIVINEHNDLLNNVEKTLFEAEQQQKGIAKNKEILTGLQKQFSDFKNEFKDYKVGTNGGLAGVSAMGMLATPLNEGGTAISAGAGSYGGQSAVAVGLTQRINSTTIRAAASYNTGGIEPIVAAAGVGYEF